MLRRGSKIGAVKCYYHDDLDGYCSGAIVKMKYPDAICFKISYGMEFDWDNIKETDTVFMVDFGLQPFDQMVKLNEICNLIWIDHHDTALKAYEASGVEVNGLRGNGTAGCELTWKYLFPNEEMPRFVKLLGNYDVWRNEDKEKWDNETMPFQYAMQGFGDDKLKPESELWMELDDNKINSIIENGKAVVGFLKQYNEEASRINAYTIEWEGLRFICLNTPHRGSFLVESAYDPNKHDAMMVWRYNGQNYTFSLYAVKDGIHVGNIAKKHGGGGHFGAAGFSMTKDEFEKIFKRVM